MAGGPVITCPECTKKFKTKTDVAGKKIRCPNCQKIFAVPPAPPDAEAVQAAAPISGSSAVPGRATWDDDEDDNPYVVKEQDLKPRCPNCANEMADKNATICLYCGYNTLTREWGKTEKVIGHTAGDYVKHLLPGFFSFAFVVLVACALMYYCVVSPIQFRGNKWLEWTDHESLRMWSTFIAMFIMWGAGYFAYKRLLIEPKPPDIKKE